MPVAGSLVEESGADDLELALDAARRWWFERPVPVSVNLTAANVTDLDLPSKVSSALRRHGLPPGALTLELVGMLFGFGP